MLKSFYHAFKGIFFAFKSERNLWIHLICMILVVGLGFYFKIELYEWLICILCIGMVLTAELFNTAIEKIMNFTHQDFHPMVGHIKDISAGAVLLSALAALVAGFIIFLPKFFALF